MLTDTSKHELAKLIKKHIVFSSKKQDVSAAKNYLTHQKGFTNKDFMRLMAHPEMVEMMPVQELVWFAEALELIGVASPGEFFTPFEIKESKTYARAETDVGSYRVLSEARVLATNQWSCVASVYQLAMMRNLNIIRTDINLQRQNKLFTMSDEILRKIHVNWKRVDEIAEKIKKDTYSYNTVRLNLMNNLISRPLYDNDSQTIILPDDGDIIIPDGNHRILACVKVCGEHPEMIELFKNRFFQVAFTFYDVRQVKDCISQEWNVEKITDKHKKAMEDNMANGVVEFIKNSANGAEPAYATAIVNTGAEMKFDNGFIMFADMSHHINQCYKVNDMVMQGQANEVARWLIEFLNYFAMLNAAEFTDTAKSRRRNHILYSNTWCALIHLSAELHDDPNWKIRLKYITKNMDWSQRHDDEPNKWSVSGIMRLFREFEKKSHG